jgi:hypothetical protein
MTVSTGTTALFTAPDGTTNADKIIATSGNVAHNINRSGIASAAYTFSVFAKAGEESVISLWLRGASVKAEFNLVSGTVSNITTTSARIENYGNGWYRCTVYDSTAGTTAHVYGRGGAAYAGNGSDGFYLWGAQLETGSAATSYIPTTTAAVTRNADVINVTGAVSGCIGQTEGTIYAEVDLRNTSSGKRLFLLSDGTSNNEIRVTSSATNAGDLQFAVRLAGTLIVNSFSPTNVYSNGIFKIAAVYKSTDYALYVNGLQVLTSNAAGNIPACNRVDIGSQLGTSNFLNDRIRAVAIYNERLSNQELIEITS